MPSLSAFFKTPGAVPVRGRPVTFRAIQRGEDALAADVRALLQFVSETDRAEANRDADRVVNSTLKPGETAPETAREDERALHVLFRALRDIDPPHGPLCRTVDELRGALTLPAAQDLWAEYQRYLSEEFPPYVDPVEFGKIVEAAKSKSFLTLPEGLDSVAVRRSLPSLANLLWK